MHSCIKKITAVLVVLGGLSVEGGDFDVAPASHCVTNVVQFKALPAADFLAGCNFHLTGVITLVDTNRNLVVLQDASGAVALNFKSKNLTFQAGRLVTIDGTNCCPFFSSFPDFPFYSSGRAICRSFETPENWGEYNLTRMRGYLHPPVTGDYRFWIASDDSSELWLSTDANPANVRKIATVPRFSWTEPRQWSKLPSQRSEPIHLKAGAAYYIEAIQEQTGGNEHLAVAWEESTAESTNITVIDGRYLTPWVDEMSGSVEAADSGILREYWTNYFSGNQEGLLGPRPYQSALTVGEVTATDRGTGVFPKPQMIDWSQPLTADNNWHWVTAKGVVKFKSFDKTTAWFEIFDGQSLIPVRVLQWSEEQSGQFKQLTNATLQVEGVCESFDDLGTIMPSLICAPSPGSVAFFESGPANESTNAPPALSAAGNSSVSGYFGTRDVVTFNDTVFGKNYIFIQSDNSALMVSLADNFIPPSQFQVGHYVDLGGALATGKYVQSIAPNFVTELGLHPMPPAIIYSTDTPMQAGRWTEVDGVAHSANTNGTLALSTKSGLVFIWPGNTASNFPTQCVDARIRARGVLLLDLLDAPTLLVPSRDYLNIVEEPPTNPFALPARAIATVLSADAATLESHRVHVVGEITYQDDHSFFVQDVSGGIRVRSAGQKKLQAGDVVEVAGFPAFAESPVSLTEPLLRPGKLAGKIVPKELDFNDGLTARQNGSLVQATALLLAQKVTGGAQVLELQEQQRVFVATLANSRGQLPPLLPGSRLRVTGVCDDEASAAAEKSPRPQFLSSLNILLQSPQDVILVSGPPWWTWKKTAALVGALLAVLSATVLWIYLLQLRLKRQQAAQLAFSQHVLGKLEEERRRIAVNLHDSLGQTLLVIKNHAELAAQPPEAAPAVKNRLGEISGTASQAIEEVRRITHGLRPYQLDRLGLAQALRTLVNQAAENRQISFASRIEDIDGLFDQDGEIHIYRIVQEAVTNVVKHAAATEVTIVIRRREDAVTFSIRDNGKGFDPAKLATRPHELGFGLTGIGERVRILKGTLAIDSHPHGGTNVTVEVPIKSA